MSGWKTMADAFADGFQQGEARGREEQASRCLKETADRIATVIKPPLCFMCGEQLRLVCDICDRDPT
jgi:hypothetical protein